MHAAASMVLDLKIAINKKGMSPTGIQIYGYSDYQLPCYPYVYLHCTHQSCHFKYTII